MLLIAAHTRYSLVKGERIVRFVRTAQLRAVHRRHCLYSYARRNVSSTIAHRGGTNSFLMNYYQEAVSVGPVSSSWAVLDGTKKSPCACRRRKTFAVLVVGILQFHFHPSAPLSPTAAVPHHGRRRIASRPADS